MDATDTMRKRAGFAYERIEAGDGFECDGFAVYCLEPWCDEDRFDGPLLRDAIAAAMAHRGAAHPPRDLVAEVHARAGAEVSAALDEALARQPYPLLTVSQARDAAGLPLLAPEVAAAFDVPLSLLGAEGYENAEAQKEREFKRLYLNEWKLTDEASEELRARFKAAVEAGEVRHLVDVPAEYREANPPMSIAHKPKPIEDVRTSGVVSRFDRIAAWLVPAIAAIAVALVIIAAQQPSAAW